MSALLDRLGRATWAIYVIALLLFLLLFVLPAVLILQAIGILSKYRKCTPEELAADLRKFADGTEGDRDWDDLECGGPFEDPRLEAIRQEAMHVELPLRPEDRIMLGALAFRAGSLRGT